MPSFRTPKGQWVSQCNTSTFWQALPRCSQSLDLHKTASAHALLISWELLMPGLALFPFRCVFHPKRSHKAFLLRGKQLRICPLCQAIERNEFSLDHMETREMGLRKRDFWQFSVLLSIKDKKENKPEASQSRIFFLFKWRPSAYSWSYNCTRGREHSILIFPAVIY